MQTTYFNSSPGKATDCLNVFRLPARLDVQQTALLLGFAPEAIPVLISAGLLRPLGKPAPNGNKHFAACEIETLRTDPGWLDKATRAMHRHWQQRNGTIDRAEAAGQKS